MTSTAWSPGSPHPSRAARSCRTVGTSSGLPWSPRENASGRDREHTSRRHGVCNAEGLSSRHGGLRSQASLRRPRLHRPLPRRRRGWHGKDARRSRSDRGSYRAAAARQRRRPHRHHLHLLERRYRPTEHRQARCSRRRNQAAVDPHNDAGDPASRSQSSDARRKQDGEPDRLHSGHLVRQGPPRRPRRRARPARLAARTDRRRRPRRGERTAPHPPDGRQQAPLGLDLCKPRRTRRHPRPGSRSEVPHGRPAQARPGRPA